MNFSLVFITPEKTLARETELVNAFFINGLKRLHVRKSSYNLNDYRNYISSINKKYHPQISIHENFELVEEFPSIGIHIKSNCIKDSDLMNKIKNIKPSILSTSFHSWEEIKENEANYNYVFISPVFNSISKRGYKAAIDITKVSEVKNRLSSQNKCCPDIIALGGIDASKISILHTNRFDGVAVLGSVWQAANPIKAFEEIKKTITRLSNA